MTEIGQRRVITPFPAENARVGRWLWALEDCRARTLKMVQAVDQATLDAVPVGLDNSIGALLYHIALIEADYLCIDVMGREDFLEELTPLFPWDVCYQTGRLTRVAGVPLSDHLARLAAVREQVIADFALLTEEQMDTARLLPEWGFLVSPAWVLHHLAQHEAEHRWEIGSLLTLLSPVGVPAL